MSPASVQILRGGIVLLSAAASLLFAAMVSIATALLTRNDQPQYLVLGSMFLLALTGAAFVFRWIGWRARVVLALSLIVAAYSLAPRSMCASESSAEIGCQ